MNNCAGCGKAFRNPAHLSRHARRCYIFRNGRLDPPESEDAYRERLREEANRAAEWEEARQRAMGLLDGTSGQWWGNGSLM